ncbi:multicopper oxidase family protein [Granulicella tundricola]|uniref:Bilirubin oxidase n=1 Tax=Granulicella tundricola (strain ATCC BAA-1859 / DSM 23138 / MP5ACTX9) TaxID=1198114 RepID=E8WV80_GRATM|nr:multicopper oxidase domain-containing protein [Granulicella tundricola]ADW67255.1 Bilirubin oxidase [Granulicella tundricola MP5ACTX9]
MNMGQTMHKTPAAPDHTVPMLHSLELMPFVDAMPVPPSLLKATASHASLRIAMREIHAKVHRDVPATRMWSYGPEALGPVIEARSGHPMSVQWVNNLPVKHFLPIDHSLHGCGRDIPDVRTCVHVHGARVPTKDDGHPEDWFTPGNSRTSHYPLEQESATLWFHDHAMGINRLNHYAGLFGMFWLRDEQEDALHLPNGKYELPLVLYDRDFTTDGQLFYPTSGDPEHPWVSEFTADAILVNGKIRPYLEVEPRLYRFRTVVAANSRFFGLTLSTGASLVQIGSDQGLLSAAVEVPRLNIAPGERADLLIDFSKHAGEKIHLRTGALDILEFRVAARTGAPVASLPNNIRSIPRTPETAATVTRTITLNEYQDKAQNSMLMLLNRKHWHEPVTERPRLNSTEIWEFVNQTEDTHPMHLHLVRFQILDRRPFDTFQYLMQKEMRFQGPAEAPAPNEQGWKDIVHCPPGMVTRIIVKFEGYTGDYLYHCHILEHEANDMMRPFEVIA